MNRMRNVDGPGGWLTTAWKQHWHALALLVVPIGVAVWSTGIESSLPLLVLPAAAFAVGYALAPRHVWIVWLGAVVIQWIAMGVLGKYNDPEGETVGSLIIEAFAWMAFGVLLPVWLGRTARQLMGRNRPTRRPSG
jgi:hypothetical protein